MQISTMSRTFSYNGLQLPDPDNHLTPEQVRGMSVFFDKAKCDRCHENANFTLNAYANLGVLVALVKLAGLALVVAGVGLWAFGAVMLLVAAMASAFDHDHVWASTAALREVASPWGGGA